jgi:hypothetical protein
MYIVDDNLLRFLPHWFVRVDASDERWIDIECWLDFHTVAGAALCDDRAFFADRGEAEQFASIWNGSVEEWKPQV